MEILTFNSVLRIDAPGLAGFYRVLVPEGPGGMHLLYRVAPLPSNEAGERLRVKAARRSAKKGRAFENSKRIWVSSEELRKLKDSGLCKVVEFEIDSGRGTIGREDIKPDGDKPGRQATKLRNTARERRRLEIMAEFMDGRILQEALASEQGLGALVSRAVATHKCARSKVYAWFELLCVFGFVGDALRLRYDRCGAKGQARVWGAKLKKPGRPGVRALSNPDRGPGSIAGLSEFLCSRR